MADLDASVPTRAVKDRRRVWTAAQKRRIVADSFAPGASVAAVALQHGVNANQLFTWRRQIGGAVMTAEAAPARLLPVAIAAAAPPPASVEAGGRMEIVLPGGERVIVWADVEAAALSRVVKVLARR
ncbi:MAG TPA: transposase [Roseiarcus sp.]|nr:transposase [Roseiarcus sp.]